jgi:hypothetical protein
MVLAFNPIWHCLAAPAACCLLTCYLQGSSPRPQLTPAAAPALSDIPKAKVSSSAGLSATLSLISLNPRTHLSQNSALKPKLHMFLITIIIFNFDPSVGLNFNPQPNLRLNLSPKDLVLGKGLTPPSLPLLPVSL